MRLRVLTLVSCLAALAVPSVNAAEGGAGKKTPGTAEVPTPATPQGLTTAAGAAKGDEASREIDIAAKRLLGTAQDALVAKDSERAVKILTALIEKYPTSRIRFDAWMVLGRHYLTARDEAKAVDFFRKVKDLDRDGKVLEGDVLDMYLEALYQTGVCYFNLKKYDAAFPSLRKITSAYPNTVWANQSYYYIGMAHFDQGNWAQAIEDLSLVGTFVDGAGVESEFVEAGRRLYVKVEDSDLPIALRISKRGSGIDRIEIATGSGDKESLVFVPLAEKRGVYLGSIGTEVGSPKPGDGVLQVIGGDTVTTRYIDQSTKDGAANVLRERKVKVASTAALTFTRGTFEGLAAAGFIGQPAFIQVLDADEDTSDKADNVQLSVVSRFSEDASGDETQVNPLDFGAKTQTKSWKIRDKIKMVLTEVGSATGAVHAGRFQGQIALVKAGTDGSGASQTPSSTADRPLLCAVGDEVLVTYVDQFHALGNQSREVNAKIMVLGEMIVDPSTANAQHQDPVIATKVKLVEAKSVLEIARIFKSMGLTDGAKRKADEGLGKVDSVIKDSNQLPGELREEAFRLRWELQLAQDDLDAAFVTCQLFTKYFPESSFADQALLGIGKIRLDRGLFREAIAVLDQVLKLPNSLSKPEAQFLIAQGTERMALEAGKASVKSADRGAAPPESEIKAKALESAVLLYKKVSDLYPDSAFAGDSLAKQVQYHIDAKDFTQANDLLEQIFVNHPDKPWLHKMLLSWTVLAYRTGDYQKALDKCNQILLNYPSSPSAATALDILPKIEAKMKASAPAPAKPDAAKEEATK